MSKKPICCEFNLPIKEKIFVPVYKSEIDLIPCGYTVFDPDKLEKIIPHFKLVSNAQLKIIL